MNPCGHVSWCARPPAGERFSEHRLKIVDAIITAKYFIDKWAGSIDPCKIWVESSIVRSLIEMHPRFDGENLDLGGGSIEIINGFFPDTVGHALIASILATDKPVQRDRLVVATERGYVPVLVIDHPMSI